MLSRKTLTHVPRMVALVCFSSNKARRDYFALGAHKRKHKLHKLPASEQKIGLSIRWAKEWIKSLDYFGRSTRWAKEGNAMWTKGLDYFKQHRGDPVPLLACKISNSCIALLSIKSWTNPGIKVVCYRAGIVAQGPCLTRSVMPFDCWPIFVPSRLLFVYIAGALHWLLAR